MYNLEAFWLNLSPLDHILATDNVLAMTFIFPFVFSSLEQSVWKWHCQNLFRFNRPQHDRQNFPSQHSNSINSTNIFSFTPDPKKSFKQKPSAKKLIIYAYHSWATLDTARRGQDPNRRSIVSGKKLTPNYFGMQI